MANVEILSEELLEIEFNFWALPFNSHYFITFCIRAFFLTYIIYKSLFLIQIRTAKFIQYFSNIL